MAKGRKLTMTDKVINYLRKSKKRNLTYGELAKDLRSVPMAVGQALKAAGKRPGMKRLTNRVKAA